MRTAINPGIFDKRRGWSHVRSVFLGAGFSGHLSGFFGDLLLPLLELVLGAQVAEAALLSLLAASRLVVPDAGLTRARSVIDGTL